MENLNELAGFLEKYWLHVVAIVVGAGSFLYRLKRIIEVLDWFGYRRLAKLKNIESYTKSSKLKKMLTRLKDEEAFRAATKIYAEGRLEKMINLIEISRGELNLITIRRAQQFFLHNSVEIRIRSFSFFDHLAVWCSAILGLVIYFSAASLFVAISHSASTQLVAKTITKPESLTWILGSFAFLLLAWVIAIVIMQPVISYQAAKKVRAYLAKEPKICQNVPT